MLRLRALAIIVFYLSICVQVYSQTTISQEDILSIYKTDYTEEELDCMIPSLRKYFYEGNYEKVIDIVPPLIEEAQKLNATTTLARLRSVLGNSFIQLDDQLGAYELFQATLEDNIASKDTIGIMSSYVNLGNTFIVEQPERARSYFENALELAKKTAANELVIFVAHNNLAELYVGTKEVKKAQFHLSKARSMLDQDAFIDVKDEYMATVLHSQGAIDLLKGNYNNAINSLERSLKFGEGILDENYLIRNYINLMTAYEKTGQFKKVNDIRNIYEPLINKRYEENKIKQQKIAASRFNLDTYRQKLRQSELENELSIQKAEKNKFQLRAIYSVSTVLLLFIGTLLYARNKRDKLLRDLTLKNQQYLEAKEKSEHLAQSNTKFLSTISHELRTPLYGIIGLSSVFLKDPKLKSHTDDLNSLKFSADYLLALVNDVLNLNKFSSKEGQKRQEVHFKLEELLPHIVQSFAFINKKNNNTVNVHLDATIPAVLYGDKTKISQVLMNLISNASKFTQDGTIDISVSTVSKDQEKAKLLFTIKDTGQGIAQKEQALIFDEFTQVANTNELQGTGLGLPIVNKILLLLESKLHLKSELHKGSEFSFELITTIGSEEELQTSPTSTPFNFNTLKDKTILIVDDNKINQVVTQKVLEQQGMRHQTASNGLEAVNLVKEKDFDCILMDINMPVMNGIEASRTIRRFNTHTPIIALTATNYSKGNEDLKTNGINNSIVKPYKTEELLEMLVSNMP